MDISARLAPHYSLFRVAERTLLTGHSHQAWPDRARSGQLRAFEDAAYRVDDKWQRAFAQAERVREGLRELLGEPGADLALGVSTHELVLRFLSTLDLRTRPRLVTTTAEFTSLRRQLDRLAESGLEVIRIETDPIDTLSARLASAIDGRTAAVLVSVVQFDTGRMVQGLDCVATAAASHGAELLVDAYHCLGVRPYPWTSIANAWIVGGGYKYLQLGEGNCYLRLPPQARDRRPAITGWFAEFGLMAGDSPPGIVRYPSGVDRFAGATYDPTSHYRAAAVFDFFAEHGLTAPVLHDISARQMSLLRDGFDSLDLPETLIRRDRDDSGPIGGFLALRSPQAAGIRSRLAERGVHTDVRGPFLRLGPAPYLSDRQLDEALSALAEVTRDLLKSVA